MQHPTELPADELDRMIDTIAPEAVILEASPVETGHHIVYRLTVDTPEAERDCYLKATPEGTHPTVDLEARILAILATHTEIPVPEVYGVVDDLDGLPSPYVLLEAIPEEVRSRKELATVSDDFLRGIAHESGRYLAELHSLDAVDAFGFLTPDGPELHGGRPGGDFDAIRVVDPVEDWRDRYRDGANEALNEIEDTRFADVVPDIEPIVAARIADLEGPFEPVLARIDQALGNIVSNQGEIVGLLDWEFTVASTPADDVNYVTWSLAGGPYLLAPDVPDRRELILESVIEGYEANSDRPVAERLRANRDCYELLVTLRSMVHLNEWYRTFDLGDSIEPAARALRDELATHL